jgi:hypothetical protein
MSGTNAFMFLSHYHALVHTNFSFVIVSLLGITLLFSNAVIFNCQPHEYEVENVMGMLDNPDFVWNVIRAQNYRFRAVLGRIGIVSTILNTVWIATMLVWNMKVKSWIVQSILWRLSLCILITSSILCNARFVTKNLRWYD